MTAVIAALVMVAIPFVVVSALVRLAERWQDRRDLQRDQQILLTDAIHWELGAVAAPVVRRRPDGGWRVSMVVPIDQPILVTALLRVTARHFAAEQPGSGPLEIVLTPTKPVAPQCSVKSLVTTRSTTTRPLAA